MAENELQELINGIFSRIKEKYGYTDEQALIYLQGCQDCAEENQKSLEKRDKMLRDTIAELCEAKRLLKMAVEDLSKMPCNNDTHRPDSCYICVKHGNCSYTDGFKWCRADIALKLIGEQNDENN